VRTVLAVAWSGVTAVTLHPIRSATAVVCIVAVLIPYVCGAAIARGVRAEADAAIRAGPELHVTRTRFGRASPIPLSAADKYAAIPGVREVVPRIVGELALGVEIVPVIVVGLPPAAIPGFAAGTRSAAGGPEFVVGAELARRLKLKKGSLLPPFYHAKGGDRVSRIIGVLGEDAPPASGHLMYTSFATAQEMFGEEGFATDLLISCQRGYRDAVRQKLKRDDPALRITTQEESRAQLPASLRHLDGIFQIHFALAFAVGIPLLLVASGIGLMDRRREAALLKATGWMTDELLLRAFVESVVLCLLASSIAVISAWAWLAIGSGRGIAEIFLPGRALGTSMAVPYRLGLEASLVASTLSLCIVGVGSLYSTWRVATAPPGLVLR
jgi:ABC-type lipoprotein release transport system permease subunit